MSFEDNYPHPLAGVDEVGRGPLAGPVVAACVIVNQSLFPHTYRPLIQDSKKISRTKRCFVYEELINHQSISVSIGQASVEEIDKLNILQASLLAMRRAIENISLSFSTLLVDGPYKPVEQAIPIIRGDEKCFSIALASIIAKETRDRLMDALHLQHPVYAWDRNAGYPTQHHRAMIKEFGITKHHRKSFKLFKN